MSILTSYGKVLTLFKNHFGANLHVSYFGFKVNGVLRKKLEFIELILSTYSMKILNMVR